MAQKKKTKDWIQNTKLDKGAFTRWCKAHGFNGVTDKCIAEGKKAGGKTEKRAVLAENFRKMAKKKKKG